MKIILLVQIFLGSLGWTDTSWYEYLESEDQDEAENIGKFSVYFVWAIIVILFGFTIKRQNKNNESVWIWKLIQYIAFARWIPMIDVDFPPYYLVIFQEFSKIMDFEEILDDGPGETIDSDRLAAFNVKSSLFYQNAEGWLFLFFGVFILFWVIMCNERTFFRRQREAAKYSMIIRLGFLISMDMSIYSMLQLMYVDFSPIEPMAGSILAILTLLFICILTLTIPVIISKQADYLEQSTRHVWKFETIIVEMKNEGTFATYQYYTLFMFSRIMAGAWYTAWWDQAEAQYSIIFIFQTLIVAYVALKKPFRTRYMQILSLSQEIIVILLLIHAGLCFSDDWSYDERKFISYAGFGLFAWGIILPVIGFVFCWNSQDGPAAISTVWVDEDDNKKKNSDSLNVTNENSGQETKPNQVAPKLDFEKNGDVKIKNFNFKDHNPMYNIESYVAENESFPIAPDRQIMQNYQHDKQRLGRNEADPEEDVISKKERRQVIHAHADYPNQDLFDLTLDKLNQRKEENEENQNFEFMNHEDDDAWFYGGADDD